MIVCSCNVLTAAQILATLEDEHQTGPRSPAQAYRCLGCAPQCGRCLQTVRALLSGTAPANPLVDGIAAFREAYEHISHSPIYPMFSQLASDGRMLGIHIVVTGDRPVSGSP